VIFRSFQKSSISPDVFACKFIIFLVTTFFSLPFYAQQEPHFSQYIDNSLIYNPAYAGHKQMLNITAIHRQQWIGIAGNPRTSIISIHSPINYPSIGLGVSIMDDSHGLLHIQSLDADWSYSFPLQHNAHLSFGVKFTGQLVNFDRSKIQVPNNISPIIPILWTQKLFPTAGAGILYHSERFFVGISSPKILTIQRDKNNHEFQKRHYFLSLGSLSRLGEQWKLRSSIQIKHTLFTPPSIDATLLFIYEDKFQIGILYRYDTSIGMIAQIQLWPQLRIGLASEYGIKGLYQYGIGTGEIMMTYDFTILKKGVYSPRYF